MTGIPYWFDAPTVWDTVVLGGVSMPGVAEVEVDRELEIDEKKPKGTHKATPTVQGVKSATVKIHITINTSDEWTALQAAIVTLEPKAGTGKNSGVPVDIAHPVTSARGITSILIKKLTGPKKAADGKALCTLEIDAMEFTPPAKVTGTGVGGAGSKTQNYNFVGTFVDFAGNLSSHIANAVPADQDVTKQAYYVDNHGVKFIGKFVMPDQPLIDALARAAVGSNGKDITSTPAAAKGGDDNGDTAKPADPATTDATP